MPITPAIGVNYKAGALVGQFLATDTYMVALYDSNANLNAYTPTYTPNNECSGGNYPTGGLPITGFQVVTDLTTVILTFNNSVTFLNTSLPDIRGCMIYDMTQGNTMVACFDFGQSLSTFNDSFKLTVPGPTATTGLIRFS